VSYTKIIFIISLLLVSLLIACGEKEETAEKTATKTTADLLSTDFAELTRTSEPAVFVGEHLYEHINGGAELYNLYKFEEVANAYYEYQDRELVADIFKFSNSENAFGLYSLLRPDEIEPFKIGVEGFTAPGSVFFVKGDYVVQLTGFDETEATATGLKKIATAIAGAITGTTDLPGAFGSFLSENAVPHTEKYTAEAFLGQAVLTEVYSRAYLIGDETITLFMTADNRSEKYIVWQAAVTATESTLPKFDFPGFEEGLSFMTESAFYGQILGGKKSAKLIGCLGYQPEADELITNWLATLP